MSISKEKILEALAPHIEAEKVSGIVINGAKIGFAIEVESPNKELQTACEKAVFALPGVEKVNVVQTSATGQITVENKDSNPLNRQDPLQGVKRIIAVASGKGGVGKSTIAVNLAVAAAQTGLKVGLLDADIYGPSLPRMMNLSEKPKLQDNLMTPQESNGVLCNSIGLLIKEEDAAIWRGPMATKALHQILKGTNWGINGDLDILFLDLPPGTGDIHLTLAQHYPIDGAIMVTTPQEVALADVKKAAAMFARVNIPILGVVENMSYFVDAESGNKTHIFGQGGGQKFADSIDSELLGEIPLNPEIGQNADTGTPNPPAIFAETIEKISKKLSK